MKERLKRLVFGLLRKDPEAVVVSFLTGNAELAAGMLEEIRSLEPGRRHFAVSIEASGSVGRRSGAARAGHAVEFVPAACGNVFGDCE